MGVVIEYSDLVFMRCFVLDFIPMCTVLANVYQNSYT